MEYGALKWLSVVSNNSILSTLKNIIKYALSHASKLVYKGEDMVSIKPYTGYRNYDAVVLRRWGVESNVWFINRGDNQR